MSDNADWSVRCRVSWIASNGTLTKAEEVSARYASSQEGGGIVLPSLTPPNQDGRYTLRVNGFFGTYEMSVQVEPAGPPGSPPLWPAVSNLRIGPNPFG
jgi:hypothetical protein